MAVSSQQFVSYLYERLLAKLSNDSFSDTWSIAGFVVVFLFWCLVLTLFMTVFFTSSCGRCFENPSVKVNRVDVAPATPAGRLLSVPDVSHLTVYTAPSIVPVEEPGGQKTEAASPPPLSPKKNVNSKKSKHTSKSAGRSRSQKSSKKRNSTAAR